MRWLAAIVVVLLCSCATLQKHAGGDADVGVIKPVVEAPRVTQQGEANRYSGGAGWVALVAGLNSMVIGGLILQHLRSSRDRSKMRTKVDVLVSERKAR